MFVINATDYAPVTPVTPPCDIIPIFIGYKGENHARCLIFDLTDCIEEFGDGGFAISFMRHGDAQPYIVTDTDQLDYTAIWEINSADTAVEGYGMVQLQYIVGETVCKTAMYRTVTFDSNESAGDVPDPYENLLDQIAAYAALAQGSAAAAERAEVNAAAQADRIISTTADAVGDWLEDNIGEISGYVIDKSLTVSDAAADAKVAGDWIRASFFTDEANGSVASFPDGADGVPVKDLKVSITAVQTGTSDPAPNNIRPITGWSQAAINVTSKNLFNKNRTTDGSYLKTDGTIGTSATFCYTDYIGVKPSSTLYYIGCTNQFGSSPCTQFYDANKSFVGYVRPTSVSGTIAVPAGASFMRMSLAVADKGTCCVSNEAITAYEDFGHTYTVSFGSAGTVYGGTLDVTTGVLTVTWSRMTIDDLIQSYSGNYYFSGTPSAKKIGLENVMSEIYKNTTNSASAMPDYSVKGNASTKAVYIRDPRYTTVSDLKAAVGNEYIYFELDVPQVFALTPTQVTSLLGNNNIFADCGGSDVTYRADPRLYLEKLTNPDSDMTADANIASGSYFMVGNRLYLATSAISLGASIVPGTNCTATDLASALNAINA